MANEQIKQNYRNIADAIRAKTGENGTMTAEEMPSKIAAIETGITPTGTLDITENGNDIDVTQYAAVDVNVAGLVPTGTLDITENGVVDITMYQYVDVDVSPLIYDFNSNQFIKNRGLSDGNTPFTPVYNYEVDNDRLSIGFNHIDLTTLEEDCSNLSTLIYNQLGEENLYVPFLLASNYASASADCLLDINSWPYADEHRSTLEDAIDSLNTYNVYDISSNQICEVYFYIGQFS